MATLAEWIWNPLLSMIYLEIGVLLLIITRLKALKETWAFLKGGWRSYRRKTAKKPGLNITHKEAFWAALATSVGVGNLAGVATAIHLGGPGALFWMWISAILGISYRYFATYLALHFQPKDQRSPLFASAKSYLVHLPGPWRKLTTLFAGLIILKGLVTANLIQANSVAHALSDDFGTSNLITAIVLSSAVGAVIIGGLRQILKVSLFIAPWMVGLYILIALLTLISHPERTWDALTSVFIFAFNPMAAAGGAMGYTVLQTIQFGISRGIFSHGSGIGIAPFFHAANNDTPAHGAKVSALIPIADTLIICTLTGLVVISSGGWSVWNGAYLTVSAFEAVWGLEGRVIVTICLIIFAFTTMINWAHFSERCFLYLGGQKKFFRWLFVAITFSGPFMPIYLIWSLADVLIGLLIIVHLLSLTYLCLKLRRKLSQYPDSTTATFK
ncbi:alanine/glycine:cation symporter family protein [Magnetococcales bacterium HHB-1]